MLLCGICLSLRTENNLHIKFKIMNKKTKTLFANVRSIVALGVVCMLLFAMVSCESSKEPYTPDEPDDCDKTEQCDCTEPFTELKGTKWRLVGIVCGTTGTLRELAPRHCAECYTLTFETDRIAHVRNITRTEMLDLCNLPIDSRSFPALLMCESYNGRSYCDADCFLRAVWSAKSYSVTCKDCNELRLFNYRGNNPAEGVLQYSLFRRIEL